MTGTVIEHTPRKLLKRLAQETRVSKSSPRTATHLLKPSSENWCPVCCKCKKIYGTSAFNATINCEKYLPVERIAFLTPPVICELKLLHSERMLIHLHNSYAPRGKRGTGRRETQSRGPGPHSKTSPVLFQLLHRGSEEYHENPQSG
jgi:hypothetical protein